MVILLAIFLFVTAFRFWLRWLNLSYLKTHGHTVPHEFESVVNSEILGKIADYTIENSRVGLLELVIDSMLILIFFFWGFLETYDRWVASLFPGYFSSGVAFFLIILLCRELLAVPFSLYRTFRIENRYGFNTMTPRLWMSDFAKSLIVSSIIISIVILVVLFIFQASPVWWWLWVWLFLLIFGIFLMYISPYVIEPLFFKFEPLKVEGLEDRIKAVLERAGLKVSRVFQVDASRRSRHSNAYFTGIGRVKKIVLFDTLLSQMSHNEIIAVLAHEAGHWKKKHVLKRMVLSEALAFIGLFAASRLMSGNALSDILMLGALSVSAKFVILGFIASLITFLLTPFMSALSRRDEREADIFAAAVTGDPDAMISSLVKLSRENLSNIHPHPLYAKFYYSHPPVAERVRSLRSIDINRHE